MFIFDTTYIRKAELMARSAHLDEKRKFTGAPYINHCESVVSILSTITDDVEVLAAGWLHDVLENTDISEFVLSYFFSKRTIDMIQDVTDPVSLKKRSLIKKAVCLRLKKADKGSKQIKLADGIDNMPSIIKNDPVFAKCYIAEKTELFHAIKDGDFFLSSGYANIINKYYQKQILQI